jgi:hypothetical protein
LLNMFLGLTRDEDDDVRNNAVFGAGELALHGGQVVERLTEMCQACTRERCYNFFIYFRRKNGVFDSRQS